MTSDLVMLLVGVLGGVITAGVAYLKHRADLRRSRLLREFSLGKGWQYRRSDGSLTVRWLGPPFFQGSRRRATNVISGTVGRGSQTFPFVAFDFRYTTSADAERGTRGSRTHRYLICAVTLPTWLPALTVGPENLLSRVGSSLVGDDIDLESEDFNRRFRVQCGDTKFASDVLSPRTMQLLLSRPALSFRIERLDVLSWAEGDLTPTRLLERVSTLSGFLEGIPSFVWRDYGVAQPAPGVSS